MRSPPHFPFGRSRLVVTVAMSALAMRVDAQEITLPRVAYGSSGWKHVIVGWGGVPGFTVPAFDDQTWPVGTAPFGTGCYCGTGYVTHWPLNTDLILRRWVDVPANGRIRVGARIDNDIQAFVGGVPISPVAMYGGCSTGELYTAISGPLPGGPTLVAIRAHDYGGCSDFDARIEVVFNADCDGDGTIDYGQILRGEVPDVDGNGVPDTCECPADVDRDGTVTAEDLAAVLFAWGMGGGRAGAADVDRSGVIDGSDLSAVLATWGPCPG